MTYGFGTYGFGPYGGAPGDLVLVSSSPTHGATGVAKNFTPLTFLFSSGDAIDPLQLEIDINGTSVLQLGGVWAFGGWDGLLDLAIDEMSLLVSITSHPDFTASRVSVLIRYGEKSWVVEFNTAFKHATFKRAKSDCGGLRVDLSFDTGDAVLVKVVRSKVAYANYVTDPGEEIYLGAYSNVYDGLVDGVYTGPLWATNKPLERATFYYYTVFSYFDVTGQPEIGDAACHVQGLALPDYFAEEGYYVYEMLPPEMRERDAAGNALGEKKYELRNLCQLMQCATNLIRGQIEALAGLRDPDTTPAGLTGVPDLQHGVLSAFVQDLGFSAERSFDAGVLRRLALGIIPALQQKGTCDGLRTFASVFTGWDVTACRDEGDAVCGRTRYAATWSDDGGGRCGWAELWYPYMGYTEVFKGALKEPLTSPSPPDTEPFTGNIPTVLADSFGGVVCIASIVDMGDRWRFVHTNPVSRLRDRAFVTISNGVSRFEDIAGPWNHPVASLPYDKDAFKGSVVKYGVGLAFDTTITSHDPGNALGQHTATFAPSSLADQTFAALYPKYPDASLRMYQGSGSVIPALHWDVGLLAAYEALSLWTVMTGGGSPMGGYAPTPNTARVTVDGVATKHVVTYVDEGFLRFAPGTLVAGAHVGDYLLANFKYPRVYRIVGNSDSEVYVVRTFGDPELDVISEPGSQAVVLSPSNALKYQQLARLITQFVPVDCDVVIDFA